MSHLTQNRSLRRRSSQPSGFTLQIDFVQNISKDDTHLANSGKNNHFMLDTQPCQYLALWMGWHCSKISSSSAY